MIYIVCSNLPLAFSYVRKELGGHPQDREFWYIAKAEDCASIELLPGDKVHKFSTNEYPMEWSLYNAWEEVERRAGLPTQAPMKPPKPQ